jgi:hypothetical protein
MGAYKKSTGHEVAVKIIEKENCGEKDIVRINEEANNLYKFNHVSSYSDNEYQLFLKPSFR